MIITLTGNNSFLLKKRLDELVADFIKKHGNLAIERIDATEVEAQFIADTVQSLPFLTNRKLVIVSDSSLNKGLVEQIEQIISSVGDTTNVIFYEPQIDRRTAIFKLLKAKTKLEDFSELDGYNLAKWLVDEAKNQGGNISQGDANYLVGRVGTNQSLLFNELQKLLLYNSSVTRATIDLLTEQTPQSKVFDLLDAAFAGRREQALKLYSDQRAQKIEPQVVHAMITWQLQQIAVAKYAKGKSASEISKDSGMKEYPISKAIGLAARLDENKLNNLISEALEIDLLSKTTPLDMDEALKTFIISL